MTHFHMVTFYYSDFQIKFIEEVFTKSSHFCEESFFNFLNGNEIDDPEHLVTYSSNNIQMVKVKQHQKNNSYLQL